MSHLLATPGAAGANSYLTVVEADTYYTGRLFADIWTDADTTTKEAALIWATRTIDILMQALRELRLMGDEYCYWTRRGWTGAPVTSTQALAWPRTGMYNRNGFAIATTVIPQQLKDAVAELAGQLIRADRTLDNDTAVQGIASVRAGSVAVSFRDHIETTKILPDAVLLLLVPSWMTDEIIDCATQQALFDVVSR